MLLEKGKVKRKKKKKQKCLKRWGQFCPNIFPTFYSNFLSNSERLYFEGGGEKTCGPHHFSIPLPVSTKHPSHSFSLLFSTLFFSIHSTKHTLNLWRLPASYSPWVSFPLLSTTSMVTTTSHRDGGTFFVAKLWKNDLLHYKMNISLILHCESFYIVIFIFFFFFFWVRVFKFIF